LLCFHVIYSRSEASAEEVVKEISSVGTWVKVRKQIPAAITPSNNRGYKRRIYRLTFKTFNPDSNGAQHLVNHNNTAVHLTRGAAVYSQGEYILF